MRVYVPATLRTLAELHRAGQLPGPPYDACAVTPALRAELGEGDAEELEWAASEEAALVSLGLLAADPGAPPRRVVLPADVPDDTVVPAEDDLGPAGVRVLAPLRLADVASVHVDAVEAEPAVRAAAAALDAYWADDPAAAAVVEALDSHALEWYATQEMDELR